MCYNNIIINTNHLFFKRQNKSLLFLKSQTSIFVFTCCSFSRPECTLKSRVLRFRSSLQRRLLKTTISTTDTQPLDTCLLYILFIYNHSFSHTPVSRELNTFLKGIVIFRPNSAIDSSLCHTIRSDGISVLSRESDFRNSSLCFGFVWMYVNSQPLDVCFRAAKNRGHPPHFR